MGRTSDARERLLRSAMELIYARGYSSVGVKELCEHAGVNKCSFYHFFPSKRALCLEVIDSYREWTFGMLEEAMTADLPPLERIERLFELVYEHHRSMVQANGRMQGCPIGNLAVELSPQDEEFRRKLQQIYDGWTAYIERALGDAVASEDGVDIDPLASAQAIVAYLEGSSLLATTSNEPELFKRLARKAVQLAGTGSPSN